MRETIVLEHDYMVNNDQLFALRSSDNGSSVNSECAEVYTLSPFLLLCFQTGFLFEVIK